ncbi:MAG: type II CRISPR RNA-guided endonuclease Cas9, partial [Candidatus Sumerlaeaceae bacterium]
MENTPDTLNSIDPMNSASSNDIHGWALGLDVGANSIGWMLVRDFPIPGSLNAIGGVRVFPAATATEKNTEKSKTAERRAARGMRRQHDRRSRRLRRLTYVLREIGLLPPKSEPIHDIYLLDPYELRARGLDERLDPKELARALLHLAHRRGFKSNRKATKDEKENKKIKEQIASLTEEMKSHGCRTVGEFLYKCVPVPQTRRRARYLHRTMIREEFEQLWEAQQRFHPELLTEDARKKVDDAIFWQRPFLKPERLERLVGQCEFEPTEKRARVGHRLVQRYRIAQEVANLRLISPDGAERTLSEKEMAQVREYLEHNKKLEIEADDKRLTKLHKLLGLQPEIEINFARGGRRWLKGNEAEIELSKALGHTWDKLTEEQKDALNELVLNEPDDEKLTAEAQSKFELTREEAEALAKVNLPDRFGRVSLKAIRNLLPHLEAGKDLHDAIVACGYDKRHNPSRIYDFLPFPPGTRFAPQREQELIEQGLLLPNTTEITNPIVRKALFEVRKVVNAIIRKYGKPKRIVVELARDTRGSIEERAELAKKQRDRENKNQEICQELKTKGIPDPSKTDILKYRLWQECNRTCPYSGQPITFEQLFLTGEVEIEHILPYTRSLDDSFANKTLCFREWNQKKGDRTPYEAFAETDPEAYEKILERVRRFTGEFRKQKLRRFTQKTVELDQFVQRQLNDTRYISRVVSQYLRTLGVDVRVARGQVTAALRHQWGLNKILAPDGSEEK